MQTVLVTGAAGFLGSHLCDALLASGSTVYAIDNFCTGNMQNVSHLTNEKNFKFIESDISKGVPVDLKMKFDQIYHLASPASPPKYLALPIETMHVNTNGTEHLLNHIHEFGGRLLFASTSEIYGDPLEHPQSESYWGNVNPIGPRSVYDEAKRYGETLLSQYARAGWADTAIVRIFNTYGPRLDPDDGRVISSFLRNGILNKPLEIYGDGTQTRSFCYVEDLITGLIATMESGLPGPINLGNPNEFTLLELVDQVGTVLQIEPELLFKPLPENDPRKRKPNIQLAKTALNWEPQVELNEGLTLTAEWMKRELKSRNLG
jgi:nucleoside-diphosphate-sugar epimerase